MPSAKRAHVSPATQAPLTLRPSPKHMSHVAVGALVGLLGLVEGDVVGLDVVGLTLGDPVGNFVGDVVMSQLLNPLVLVVESPGH